MGETKSKGDQKYYPVECCVCGCEFNAARSILQMMGQNDAGHGTCPECKQFLNLTYVPQEEKMVSKKWEDYIAEIKDKDNGSL